MHWLRKFRWLFRRSQAEADMASAKAAVQTAQINLDYASVRAPIAGRIGQALVTEGALVSATEATQLAVIQQTNSISLSDALRTVPGEGSISACRRAWMRAA